MTRVSTPPTKLRARMATVMSLAITAGLALAGCSASPQSSNQTLTVQVQSGQMGMVFKEIAATFEKQNKGVKVKLQTITDQQKITTNGQILASSSTPDIGIVPTNAQSFTDLTKAKALLPLTDVWKAADLQKRYGTAVADSLKTNGTPYVTLFDQTLYNIIFYNKDLFSKAGIAEPANHQIESNADLYKITSALKAAGSEGVAIGGNAGYKWGWLLDAQLFANAPQNAVNDFNTSWQVGKTQKVKYTSPEFLDSVKNIQTWFQNGVFPNGALGQGDDQSQALFISGKAGMLLGGSYSPPLIDKDNPSFKYGWLLLPGINGGKATVPTAYAGDTLAVPVKAKHPDLAKKFLQLVVSDEMQARQAKISSALPAVNSVPKSDLQTLNPVTLDILTFASKNGAGTGWTSVAPGGLAQSFIDPQIQKLLGGQESLAELGANQQQQFTSFKASQG